MKPLNRPTYATNLQLNNRERESAKGKKTRALRNEIFSPQLNQFHHTKSYSFKINLISGIADTKHDCEGAVYDVFRGTKQHHCGMRVSEELMSTKKDFFKISRNLARAFCIL